MKQQLRVVTVRAGGMWRRIAVRETDAQIRQRVDSLYQVAHIPSESNRLDIWLAIERELCPRHA